MRVAKIEGARGRSLLLDGELPTLREIDLAEALAQAKPISEGEEHSYRRDLEMLFRAMSTGSFGGEGGPAHSSQIPWPLPEEVALGAMKRAFGKASGEGKYYLNVRWLGGMAECRLHGLMVKVGAMPRCVDKDGNSPLHHLSANGIGKALGDLLSAWDPRDARRELERRNLAGRTPAECAVRYGMAEAIRAIDDWRARDRAEVEREILAFGCPSVARASRGVGSARSKLGRL